ncbi:hypothetical protein ACFL35_08130 [Candidatus Riflebacteria bacterium]
MRCIANMPSGIIYPFSQKNGQLQMQLDEKMLFKTILDGRARFRIYDWEEPTISLGRFQEKLKTHFLQIKRITGGRAVLHENDITYAISLPQQLIPQNKSISFIYKSLVQPVKDAIEETYSIHLEFAATQKSLKTTQNRKQPCFLSPSFKELLFKGKKIMGAAMIKKKNGLLQHGTILFKPTEKWQKEFQGSNCIGLHTIEPGITKDTICKALSQAFQKAFPINWESFSDFQDLFNRE